MKKKKAIFSLKSLQFTILNGFVSLLIVTVITILSYGYYRNSNTLLTLTNDFLNQIQETVIEKTTQYLAPAGIMSKNSSELIEFNAFNYKDFDAIEVHGRTMLDSYPQFSNYFFGDEEGNFLMVKRMPEKSIGTKTVRANGKSKGTYWKERDDKGVVFKNEFLETVDYDARTRPWYNGVKNKTEGFWTEVYIFYTDKVPGITAAFPVYFKNKFVGSFGIDINLGEISKMLHSQKVGKSGTAFVVNNSGLLIGYPDGEKIIETVNGKLRSKNIMDLDVPWVVKGYRKFKETGLTTFTFYNNRTKYIATFTAFPESFGKDWIIGLILPQDDFLGPMKRTNLETLGMALLVLILAIFVSLRISKKISKPIEQLSIDANRIRDFDLDHRVAKNSDIREIQYLQQAIASMKTGLQAFRKYVPAALVRQLIDSGLDAELGGSKKDLTILFSDIQGFTAISEGLSPEELMLHLSEYLDELTKILMEHKGTVDKYIGDAIMAFWGAPLDDKLHAYNACLSALKCQDKIRELNIKWTRENKMMLPTRIGIHTGETVVGNLGSTQRMNYTAIGDSVNLASRLEGVNKQYGTRILVSEATYKLVKDQFVFCPVDLVAVKGKTMGVGIYELVSELTHPDVTILKEYCEKFTEGFNLYKKQQWKNAENIFKILKLNTELGHEELVDLYIKRCKTFAKTSPGNDWDGVFRLKVK